MTALTKKAIRAKLSPMSRALLNGAVSGSIEMLGLTITCDRSYNRPGTVGFAWHPHFSALDPSIGRIVHGGNLTTITDQLYQRARASHAHAQNSDAQVQS